jgi:hypothetical protein
VIIEKIDEGYMIRAGRTLNRVSGNDIPVPSNIRAYDFIMSINYCKPPAEVLFWGDDVILIRKRETMEDLLNS